MTLTDYISAVRQTAYPLVNCTKEGYDIYSLNAETIRDYPLLYVMPQGQHTAQDDTTTYNITLFYIDRLTNDDANAMQIFDTALEVLKNIARSVAEIDGVVAMSDLTLQNFVETERLADRCAGAFATYQVTLINSTRCYVSRPAIITTR